MEGRTIPGLDLQCDTELISQDFFLSVISKSAEVYKEDCLWNTL